jgi:hypothetical protein
MILRIVNGRPSILFKDSDIKVGYFNKVFMFMEVFNFLHQIFQQIK